MRLSELCGSRKYPYPTTDRISQDPPPLPPLQIFYICKELMTLPPPLQNFYKVREGPPNPSGKVYFHEKRRVMPFAVTQWFSFNFFERLELEHSKLPTKQPELQKIAYPFK